MVFNFRLDYNTFMDDRNAGIALIQGAALLIPFVIAYVVFRLVKPSTHYWEKSPHNYGRLFLAHTLLYLIWTLLSLAYITPAGINAISWLVFLAVTTVTLGPLSYFIGYLYGKSKPAVVKLAQEATLITKTTIEKSVEKPVKKTVEKPQDVTTEKNIPNNKTMDEENSDEIDDEEFYLIATKEAEGSDKNNALWAKCMATSAGDETKAKYCYINKRVAVLKQEAKDKAERRKTLEEKIRNEVYVTIESNMFSASDDPEYDLSTDNLFPNSPNDDYRKKIIAQFEQKVKERLEKEFN